MSMRWLDIRQWGVKWPEEDHTDPDIFKFKFIERTLPSIGKDVELLRSSSIASKITK